MTAHPPSSRRAPARLAASLALIALAAAGQAKAQTVPAAGYYVRADIGASISADAGGNILAGTGFGQDFGTSALIGAGIGYAMPAGAEPVRLRFDLTGSDRVSYDSTHSATTSAFTFTGKTSLNSAVAMGSVYADILTGTAFIPYVGFGLGIAMNSLDRVTYAFNGTQSASEGGTTLTNFAWSVGAGVAYQLTSAIAIDGGYRYLDAGRVATDGNVRLVATGLTTRQPPVRSDLHAHELTVGLRYSF